VFGADVRSTHAERKNAAAIANEVIKACHEAPRCSLQPCSPERAQVIRGAIEWIAIESADAGPLRSI